MSAYSSPGNPSEKRAILPGCAASIFRQLRMFWITALALLIVVLYGLRAGWPTPQQWSDGFFFAASVQILIAAIIVLAPPGEAFDASSVRYLPNGNVNETRQALILETLRRREFGVRVFLGSLLTFLISAVFAWV